MKSYHSGQNPRSSRRLARGALASLLTLVPTVLIAAAPRSAEAPPSRADGGIRLVDVTAEAGIDLVHTAGFSALKHVPETMGSGVAWLDYDIDGRPDLYFVDSGTLPGIEPLVAPPPEAGANVLFRGRREGGFARRAGTGLEDRGYGMGTAVADFDDDGWADVYVSNYGPDALYRNNGDGTFAPITAAAGIDAPAWGASVAWADLDRDGWVDLFVSNYLDYELESARTCGKPTEGLRQYCPPQLFDGTADALYRNQGNGSFAEIGAAAGVVNAAEGKGLGVVASDLDGDGLLDLYVANDATRNFLYRNRGAMRFDDEGLFGGAGLNDEGQPQSGMGVDVGDLDGQPGAEIGVTNFLLEPVNLYSQIAPAMYMDVTFATGIGAATLGTLGFGLAFVDLDGDGDLDVIVANGHIEPDNERYAQPDQVFENLTVDGIVDPTAPERRFREVTERVGGGIDAPRVSRGLAHGDFDGDGRPDLVVSRSGDGASLFRNAAAADRRLVVRLRSRAGNRDAIGARVRLREAGGDRSLPAWEQEVRAGASYLSQHATDLYFGLADVAAVDLEVRWPDGTIETVEDVTPRRLLLLRQGRGVEIERPLRPGETG